MIIPHGTLIALVDGEKFELLRNTGTGTEPELSVLPSPELDTANAARTNHHSGPGNHADSLVAEGTHAAAVVAWLNQEVLAHRIEGLIVIAAPRTLGEMRPRYHGQLETVLLTELAKDLAGRRPDEILAALRQKD